MPSDVHDAKRVCFSLEMFGLNVKTFFDSLIRKLDGPLAARVGEAILMFLTAVVAHRMRNDILIFDDILSKLSTIDATEDKLCRLTDWSASRCHITESDRSDLTSILENTDNDSQVVLRNLKKPTLDANVNSVVVVVDDITPNVYLYKPAKMLEAFKKGRVLLYVNPQSISKTGRMMSWYPLKIS